MRKYGRYSLIYLSLIPGINCFGQLETNESIDEFQSVDIISPSGATTSNISFSGNPSQIGSFDGTSSNIGLESGMLLATFNIEDAEGPNDKGVSSWAGGSWSWGDEDVDLNSLCQCSGNYSAAILEFDIVATGDTLKMNYVFASEEYKEEVCGQFNDVCGIFISGPGIAGPYANNSQNIAVVPNSSAPVMTNTINGGIVGSGWSCSSGICDNFDPNWLNNTIYYVDNTGGTSVQFDGWTVPMKASTQVQNGQTYHVKIAVQNTSDAYFDSGVFLDSLFFTSTTCAFVDPNLPDTVTFCAENETVMLDAGNPGFNFQWTPGGEITQTFQTQIPGSYSVEITGTGCPDVTYVIELIDSCNCNFIDPNLPDTITYCAENETITLDAGNPGFNFQWTPGGEITQTFQTQMPGSYSVEITGTGCPDVTYVIELIDSCNCNFIDPNLPDTITYCSENETITLDAGNPGFDFQWSPGGEQTQIIQTQNLGLQTVEITGDGCPDVTYSIMLMDSCEIVESPVVIIPNVFTPNNDGSNDTFHLTCENIQSHHGNIFNRWGNKMFSWNDVNEVWDGKTAAGNDASSGTYYYVITIVGLDQSEQVLTGAFQLLK